VSNLEFLTPDFRPSGPLRILIEHGIHSGELNMDKLHSHFMNKEPEDGLDNHIISPEDWELRRRLFEGRENLNGISPARLGSRGQLLLADYCLRAQEYDLAIQPHGTSLKNGDVAIYGTTASPFLKQVASYLGQSRAIIRTRGAEAHLPHSLGIEMGVDASTPEFDELYQKIITLLHGDAVLDPAPAIDEYVYIADITTTLANALQLETYYEPLEPLTDHDTGALYNALGFSTLKLVAYGWNGAAYDGMGARGELLARLPLPESYPLSQHRERGGDLLAVQ
jgi:hypothetical protein